LAAEIDKQTAFQQEKGTKDPASTSMAVTERRDGLSMLPGRRTLHGAWMPNLSSASNSERESDMCCYLSELRVNGTK
jgi:hypothetical protein